MTSKRVSILATVLLIGTAACPPALALDVSDCEDAWDDSSASQSCGLQQVHDNLASISVSNEQCKIHVDCSTSNWNIHRTNNWTGSETDMANLSNCGGDLKVGSC